MQESDASELLTAEAVEAILGVDKSTIYRMAQDGRLSAIKVGRQWRFPANPIRSLLSGAGADFASRTPAAPTRLAGEKLQPVVDLAAELLGVMMVVTDMNGDPLTEVANPCPWFVEQAEDPAVLDACIADWRSLADENSFEPYFRVGPHGFECARALIRSGNALVGMVLAGGIAVAASEEPADAADGLYHLSSTSRAALLAALPVIAATISRLAQQPATQGKA